MAKFKCGHEKTRENTTPRGRCRECWNAYCRHHQTPEKTERREPVPPPADLAEMAKTRNKTMLRQHYGIGENRLETWLKLTGVEPARNLCIRRRHLPDDFAELAETMTAAKLAKHYKVDWTTVRRWKQETGIETAAPVRTQQNNRLPSNAFAFKGSAAIPIVRDTRLFTLYDQAADTLRRERWAVHRCDDRGRYDEKGKLWRVGNVICTPDELLARAARYGRAA